MTLIIELTPEQEARLHEAAQQQGKQPADVVAAWLNFLPRDEWPEEAVLVSQPTEADLDAFFAELDALPHSDVVLSPEATTRAAMYGERG